MKTRAFLSFHLCQRLFLFLLVGAFIGSSGALEATIVGSKLLKMQLSTDRLTAEVTVPVGVSSVTVQRFQRVGGWQKVISTPAVSGVMKFTLPPNGKEVLWRAIGWFEKSVATRGKFPASFYKGRNIFGSVKPSVGSAQWLLNRTTPVMMADSGTAVPTDAPVEADIWKVDGNTVYFFNQLRGLQVLDLTNPADPRITASLRLPAMGQDLYVLPGASGADRTVVLLTEGWSQKGGQWTRINLVKVSGAMAEIIYTQDVKGSLSDSRMAGNRLILATSEWNYSDVSSNGWSSRSRLSEWLLTTGTAPQAAGETVIDGYSPLIASGPDWLALAVQPTGQWNVSDVSVFAVRPTGLIPMAQSIRTEGAISNKFRIQWSGNVLTTISEKNSSAGVWSPTTVLENFRAWAPEVVHPMVVEDRLGRLELASGESLYATRFAGGKAYVVTFKRTDPLWVVDLADPQNPVVAGSLEVPGWSSYLQPIGDLLFSIGMESGKIAASLFDVADPALPKLLSRVDLGDQGMYSEAVWNDKALKVLPDAGLAMIPLSASYWTTGQAGVQLLDIDLTARELRLRGKIPHAFDARRADLIGNAVVSISQRVMETADISDRDAPTMLSEVSLAWPVDRVLEAGKFLFQIEDGQSYGGGRATVRVSPANAPEEILSETDLGEGIVKAADVRDGKLYVLRQTGSSWPIFYLRPINGNWDSAENKLFLDVYDASAAPSLSLLGSCSMKPDSGGQVAGARLLWPQPNRPAVLLAFRFSYWNRWGPIMIDPRIIIDPPIIDPPISVALVASLAPVKPAATVNVRPYWVPEKAPQLVVFDVSRPAAPVAGDPVNLGPVGSVLGDVSEAADGLIVAGISNYKNEKTGQWLSTGDAFQSVGVVEVGTSGTIVSRPLIDLPGELFAVSELDTNGFLAFTKTFASTGTGMTLQVNACDGFDAFFITGFDESTSVVATAGGRRVFAATADGVERHLLTEKGKFITEPALKIGWTPYSLRWIQNTLTGASWSSVFATDGDGKNLKTWDFPTWNPGLERVSLATDGDLLVPFGEYGVERLNR